MAAVRSSLNEPDRGQSEVKWSEKSLLRIQMLVVFANKKNKSFTFVVDNALILPTAIFQ
jgi:hypothetical protein